MTHVFFEMLVDHYLCVFLEMTWELTLAQSTERLCAACRSWVEATCMISALLELFFMPILSAEAPQLNIVHVKGLRDRVLLVVSHTARLVFHRTKICCSIFIREKEML